MALGLGVVAQGPIVLGAAWSLLDGVTATSLILLAAAGCVLVGLAGPSTWRWCQTPSRAPERHAARAGPRNG